MARRGVLVFGLLAAAAGPTTARAGQPGKDGALTVAAANTVVNRYAVLAANAAAGATTLTVTNIADLSPITSGDLLLVIQMQGATIDTSNSTTYGSVTALNNAGRYEFVTVGEVAGNVITLAVCTTAGVGLINPYTTAGHVQVIRVPQYTTLTVNAGASITAPAWDGSRGGMVTVHVQTTATINGQILVSGLGFRGGALDNTSADANSSITVRRSPNSDDGGEKGEGIAGSQAAYDALNGRYARGAPANGGGGGNSHNAGGGGGANGNNLNTWTGQGVMPGGVTGAAAWALDPGYVANGNALTNSSGGGRGGYAYSNDNANALTQGPGNAAWNGNLRRERGGVGGRPVTNAPATRLFFGGGGGAGDANNTSGGAGGRGGGLVYLIAATVNGGGSILANGTNGGSTTFEHRDAAGGGGAGGTVVVSAGTLGGISISANGGNGGSQTAVYAGNTNEGEGPGGGGGGGYVAITSAVATSVSSGAGGTSVSLGLTEFPRNGATDGASGRIETGSVTIPGGCFAVTRAVVSGMRLNGAELAFGVTSGRGVVALNVLGETRLGKRVRLNREELRPPVADSLGPVLYQVGLSGGTPKRIWIEERERSGRVRVMGPFVPGDERQEEAYARLEERAGRSEVREGRGSRMLVGPRERNPWSQGDGGEDGGEKARDRRPSLPRGARGVKVEVGRGGLVRLPYDEWRRSGILVEGSAGSGPWMSHRLQVTNLGRSIPFDIRDGVLEFQAESLSTDYSGKNAYLVTWGAPPSPKAELSRSGFGQQGSGYSRVERNALYAAFVAPGADPWIWDYATEGLSAPIAFGLGALAPGSGNVPLRIGLIGGTEHVHHVTARINGVVVGEVTFPGKTMGALEGSIARGALLSRGNELRLTYEAEGSTLEDPGLLFLDVLDLGIPTVEGEAEVLSVKAYDPRLPDLLGIEYLIVTHRDFMEAAERLKTLKEGEGLRAAVVDVELAFDRYSGGVFEARAILELIRQTAEKTKLRYVVLLGDDTYDPRDFLGVGNKSYVPSLYGWDGVFGRVPSETLSADVNGDGRPDVAIGRLPVRTTGEAAVLVDKISRQGRRNGEGHLIAVDESRGSDISFRGEGESLKSRLPDGSVVLADVGVQGVSAARSTLLDELKKGPKTTSYFGHGGEEVWSDQGLLRNADVSVLEGTGEETVLFSWTCESQWYLKEGRTISEELLLVPNGGTVASVGPGGISDPALQTNLSRRVYDYFLAGTSLGESVRRAKADALSEDEKLAPVVHGFNLLGDPSLFLVP